MEEADVVRRRLARLAWLLDSSIPLAGGRFRIGLDAILGLIPGFGDLVGVVFSSYIVHQAARLGAPPSVLARMVVNVAIEGIAGLVPLAGDVIDAAWKANQRNVALLDAHLASPGRTARSSRRFLAVLAAALVVFVVSIAALATLLVRGLVQVFS